MKKQNLKSFSVYERTIEEHYKKYKNVTLELFGDGSVIIADGNPVYRKFPSMFAAKDHIDSNLKNSLKK